MTNREKHINRISNEKMAEFFFMSVHGRCNYCSYCCKKECEHGDSQDNCLRGIEKWLESEAKTEADMMFVSLGYRKLEIDQANCYSQVLLEEGYFIYVSANTSSYRIVIKNDGSAFLKENYSPNEISSGYATFITQEEQAAINQKIKEIKGEI